jgi:hypothetical protein
MVALIAFALPSRHGSFAHVFERLWLAPAWRLVSAAF